MRAYKIAHAVSLWLQGQSEEEIAAALGVRRETVSRYLNSQEGRELLDKARAAALETARLTLTLSSGAASKKLTDLLNCGRPEVERKAACDILRLVWVAAPESAEEEDFLALWRRRREEYAHLTPEEVRIGEIPEGEA